MKMAATDLQVSQADRIRWEGHVGGGGGGSGVVVVCEWTWVWVDVDMGVGVFKIGLPPMHSLFLSRVFSPVCG